MTKDANPQMLVVLDADPNSMAPLTIAQRYAEGALLLTSWGVDPVEIDATVQASNAAEPALSEALQIAGQRGMLWVGVRRDFAPPRELLSELLIATAKHTDDAVPGFAVFLADGEPPPFERILAIVDRSGGSVSGLLAHAAVAVADSAGAQLDILVIGAPDENPHSEDKLDAVSISREQELYHQAVARAKAENVEHNWIMAASVTDIWPVIADQLTQHDYDLVIDDLGDVSLARVRMRHTVDGTLDDGEVGEIPLKLLTETSLPLLFVIDEIRLGIAPKSLLKAGALATVTIGAVAAPVAGAVAAPSATSASPSVESADDPISGLKADLASAVGQPMDDQTRAEDRETAAAQSSRSGGSVSARDSSGQPTAASVTVTPEAISSVAPSPPETIVEAEAIVPDEEEAEKEEKEEKEEEPKKAKKPTAPKGGASPNDVAKAQRQAAASKAELQKSKAKTQKTREAIAEAEEGLTEAQAGATVALDNLQAAEMSHGAAAEHAAEVASEATGVSAVLPGAPTEEAVATAAQAEQSAAERLDASVEFGEETLDTVLSAEETVGAKQDKLKDRRSDQAEAKADLEQAQLKSDVYKQSLSESRQSPVTKGYTITARFGASGSYWSSNHTGLDFAASSGTPVKAAASGTVVSTGYKGAYGNQVVVNHGGGVKTTYSHLSSISASPGQKVSTGDQIGKVGSTGNSTGPHLHFEVLQNGKFVNPETWLGW